MDIYILRHGKAEQISGNVKSDSKRKLTELGKKELDCIAKSIKTMNIEFTLIVSSPLTRAKQTAEIVMKHVKNKKKSLVIWDELKPEAEVKKTIKKLSVLKPGSNVLLVGHEPHLTTLIGSLISPTSNHVDISLKKGGFVHIKTIPQSSDLTGYLRSILTPKQLQKLCN